MWYQEQIGEQFIAAEAKELENLVSELYGYHLVFLGDPGIAQGLETSLIPHRILVDPRAVPEYPTVSSIKGEMDAIPLRSDSVDVVVLAHALEHTTNPHEVLREAHRILIPEGHVIITGFNPFSFMGMWHASQKNSGKMLFPHRVKDWLTLLNFQIIGGRMFYYRPPLTHLPSYQKLAFLEKWGENCWPFFAGAYTLLAVKRVVPLIPIKAKWQREKKIWQEAAEGYPKPTSTVIEK